MHAAAYTVFDQHCSLPHITYTAASSVSISSMGVSTSKPAPQTEKGCLTLLPCVRPQLLSARIIMGAAAHPFQQISRQP